MAKTTNSITRRQFASKAQPMNVTFDGKNPVHATPKEFTTGSIGWFANGKTIVMVDGVPVTCQVNVTITVVGSKELPHDSSAA